MAFSLREAGFFELARTRPRRLTGEAGRSGAVVVGDVARDLGLARRVIWVGFGASAAAMIGSPFMSNVASRCGPRNTALVPSG